MYTKRRFLQHTCAFCASGLFTGGLLARDGVEVGENSAFSRLVPAADVERSAQQQYGQLMQQAQAQGAQQADTACRHLQLRVDRLNQAQESGPTAALANTPQENRQCWSM